MGPPDGFAIRFVLAALATWRVTHLLASEDGPADIIFRLRRWLGQGWLGSLMDCFNCLSLWIAVPAAFFLSRQPIVWVMSWLALSGTACLLERLGEKPVVIEPGVQAWKETTMCCGSRRSALRSLPTPARAAAGRDHAAGPAIPRAPTIASVVIHYGGPSAIRVKGPVSGRTYDFSAARPAQAVDARDAPVLTRSGVFSRVQPS